MKILNTFPILIHSHRPLSTQNHKSSRNIFLTRLTYPDRLWIPSWVHSRPLLLLLGQASMLPAVSLISRTCKEGNQSQRSQ